MNDYELVAERPSNPWGMAGFIISIVSLLGCAGLLSPLSLIFCCIGLGKSPKAFAVAGLVISLISLPIAGIIYFAIFFVGVALAMSVAAAIALIGTNALVIGEAVHDYYDTHGALPESLAVLQLRQSELVDPWGHDFVYLPRIEDDTFALYSAGPDGLRGTDDDILGEIDFRRDFNIQIHEGIDEIDDSGWIIPRDDRGEPI